MMSLSNISAQQGETYYTHENYYCADEAQPQSEWAGIGAASLGLEGSVDRDRFSNLLNGLAPEGGRLPGRQVHRFRQSENPRKHRAGLDLTFSAPKSVSLAALVNGDRELEKAHRTAVDRTLAHIESHHALTRKWDGRKQKSVQTGNLIVAKFHHDTSRELDPQLHTHCVALNATQLPDGSWRSLSNESIYQNAKLLGSIYRNELAHEARKLGYEIERDRDCLFELKGYNPEQLEEFSQRRQQILAFVGGAEANAVERGWAAIRTRARKGKDIPREILHERWSDRAKQIGLVHPVPARDREVASDVEEARELVDLAVEHCSERSAVFRRTAIQKTVLERIQPFDLETMEAAIAEHPDLMPTLDSRFTTESARDREEAALVLMRSGRDRVEALIDDREEVDSSFEEEALTEGQRAAIRLAATTRDRFIAWQGVAGAGKTTALRRVKRLAEAAGYQVEGYAPSASAAGVLGEELAIATTTVASLLLSKQPEDSRSRLWIVDEASFLSAKDAHDLLDRATRAEARVILVGDVQQLSAVEAGHPFRSLQQGGMETAHLDESLRQHAPDLRAAVDAVARGEVKAGLERLQQFERVVAIADDDDRRDRVVEDYISLSPEERSQTLLLAGTHAERTAITEKLRQELKREGTLGRESLRLVRLKPKSLTDVQSRFSHHYDVGDVVIPTRHYPRRGLLRTEQYRVAAIASERLQLERADGTQLQVDPMSFRKQVYSPEAIAISVGDRLRRTRNDKERGHRNGQSCTVSAVDTEAQTVTVSYADDRQESLAIAASHHLDYDWVNTIHSSQGKTAKRALVTCDRAVGKEAFYVAVSRVKSELKVYTSSIDRLLERAQTSQTQENPSEVLSPQRSPARKTTAPVADEPRQLGLDLAPPASENVSPSRNEPSPLRADPASADPHQHRPEARGDREGAERPESEAASAASTAEPAGERRAVDGRFSGLRKLAALGELARNLAAAPDAVPEARTDERAVEPNSERAGASDRADAASAERADEVGRADREEIARDIESSAQNDLERGRTERETPARGAGDRERADGGSRRRAGAGLSAVDAEPDRNPRPHQRTSEQHRNQSAEDAGTVEPAISPAERQLARQVLARSDEQLLSLEKRVKRWQQTEKKWTEPPCPSEASRQQLNKRLQDSKRKRAERSKECNQAAEAVKTLGPRWSWNHLFGSAGHKVDAAEAEWKKALRNYREADATYQEVCKECRAWVGKKEKHEEWAEEHAEMLEAERALTLPPVQERVKAIHRELARRAQQERELAGQERWYQVARFLEKSQGYLNRIQEVTAELEAGEPLSEAAKTAQQEDLDEYNKRLLKQPGTLKEVNRIAEAMRDHVERKGKWRKGGQVFEGKRMRLEVAGNLFRATSQVDGCVVLEVKDNKLERYQPLAQEREDLRQYCQQVEQQQQQRERGFGFSR